MQLNSCEIKLINRAKLITPITEPSAGPQHDHSSQVKSKLQTLIFAPNH